MAASCRRQQSSVETTSWESCRATSPKTSAIAVQQTRLSSKLSESQNQSQDREVLDELEWMVAW